MSIAALRSEIESALKGRSNSLKQAAAAQLPEFVSSGIPEIDSISGGLPRGAIAELVGSASSGRTSLLLSVLAEATQRQELCALVDLNDAFDTETAMNMRIEFDSLLWIRCCSNVEHALKATELLLQSAGFGLVALDLGDHSHRVPLSSWFRLRRTVEDTPTSLLVVEQQPSARTCASLILETNRESSKWPHEQTQPLEGSTMFGGMRLRIERHKPISSKERETRFETTL